VYFSLYYRNFDYHKDKIFNAMRYNGFT